MQILTSFVASLTTMVNINLLHFYAHICSSLVTAHQCDMAQVCSAFH